MFKKLFDFGIIYFLVAVLFVIAAISKTISNNSTVLASLWFCVIVFAFLGVWRLRKATMK
jgi:hypothetical protein